MSKSIVSNEKSCFLCGTTLNLHKHHVYGGQGRRDLSEKYGCWIWLCAAHHNMSNFGVHNDHDLDLMLKKLCQKRWEQTYGTRDQFIQTFRKSYIE